MGEVIDLFTRKVEPDEPVNVDELFTEDFDQSLHEVTSLVEDIFGARTPEQIRSFVKAVKVEVATWPDG